ncbi:MAG TPA: phenylacetate--CoA ligase [Solirubrobacteraceae bacterium]|nr:phenylacetate--CoA ligase [Solirubrobacteraceae bacterium]
MSAASELVTPDWPVERLPREEMRALQLERLRATIDHVLAHQPVLGPRVRASGVASGADLASLDDLARLPFTVKQDLRDAYPWGLLAVPRETVLRVHASSGTGGKPTIVGFDAGDMAIWDECMARLMHRAGVRAGMVIHNANNYGLFTGGFGYHQGGELLGCTVVPVSGGFTQRQAMLLADLRGQVLVATPSYAIRIAQAVAEAGLGPDDLALEIGLFGGEPMTEAMRARLDEQLGLRAIDSYGLSELCGPGVAGECERRDGLHVNEDHFLPEVIDPETGQPLPHGVQGELVFTTLSKRAMPMVRYRTADLGTISGDPCPCGRTLIRMSAPVGRRDDMLIVRGVNLFPSEVEHVLLGVEGIAPHYQLVVDRPADMDTLTVHCEPADRFADLVELRTRAARALRERTGISIDVQLKAPGQVPRSEGKAVRVVDLRRPR